MGFQVSPGVNVTEKDLTTIVPAVATTNAGMAGAFRWGPVGERVLVDSENNLREIFGDPDKYNYNWFFTAANFLGYGNNLQVVRVCGASASNANSAGTKGTTLNNRTNFDGNTAAFSTAEFIAKYPGDLGNSLKVYVFDTNGKTSGGGFAASGGVDLGAESIDFYINTASGGGAAAINFNVAKGDRILWSDGDINTITASTAGVCGDTGGIQDNTLYFDEPVLSAKATGTTFDLQNRYATVFGSVPRTSATVALAGGTNDELNIAVVDHDGRISGAKGTVLETYEGLSKATNARGFDGRDNFYKSVLNDTSKWVWARANVTGINSGDNDTTTTFTSITPQADAGNYGVAELNVAAGSIGDAQSHALIEGGDANQYGTVVDAVTIHGGSGGALTDANVWNGYREFEDSETVDVSLILGGASTATVQQLIVDMVDKRKDAIAFLSPVESASDPSGLVKDKSTTDAFRNVQTFRNTTLNKSSSYAVLDSGFKTMLDRYNNVLRSVPLNADIAGLCARTEREQEAWFSPAGFNRGQIRGVVKLDFNPRKAHRDELYLDQVNPVVAFPGEGTVLFGDKTLQSKPSAFDRINVRRLFIVLEKAIATAAKFLLFEFNDEFTRAQFRNMVIPFLRTVQSRRGIFEFKVVCDESNNTGEVIDRNEFIGDIYIKPARSINFIQLNFIATRTGVDFSEVGG
jgi:hypothetical protein